MKKTILYLIIIIAVASTGFVTSATAAPKITGIQGGFGVTATVANANNRDWQITLRGAHIIRGMITEGTISGDSATIQTLGFPPACGFGKIFIKVTIGRIILPDVVEVRTAFMLGPCVLFVHNIPSECPN
jgi:hypothetical protein